MSFEMTNVDPHVMSLLMGHDIPTTPTPVSIVIDTIEEVSGEPCRPRRVPGFRAWLKRTNEKAEDQYHREHLLWLLEGMPTKTVTTRTYIPRASLVTPEKGTPT